MIHTPTKTTVRLWEVPVNGLPTCTGLVRHESQLERLQSTLRRERARIIAREEVFVLGSYNANDFACRVRFHTEVTIPELEEQEMDHQMRASEYGRT